MGKAKDYQVHVIPETPRVIREIQHVLMAAEFADHLNRHYGYGRQDAYDILHSNMLHEAYGLMVTAHPEHTTKVWRDDTERRAIAIYRFLKGRGFIISDDPEPS